MSFDPDGIKDGHQREQKAKLEAEREQIMSHISASAANFPYPINEHGPLPTVSAPTINSIPLPSLYASRPQEQQTPKQWLASQLLLEMVRQHPNASAITLAQNAKAAAGVIFSD